jgi:hypothetical protein
MSVVASPTVIVSPDKSAGLEAILDEYCAAIGNNCIRKKEAELTSDDFSKHLFVIGVVGDLKKWDKYQVSIRAIEKGFSVNNKKFQAKSDAFAYVDSNRILIAGNSLQAVKDAKLAFTGGHGLLVTQGGKITFFGNKEGPQFHWFNLQNLKESNYSKKTFPPFSGVYLSKTFKDTIDFIKVNHDLQSYVQQFLSVYKLKLPSKKVDWFIHSNMQEYGTMSGMFGLTCPGNNSAGFSIRGEIHTKGFNTGLVKHEYSHFLFDNTIPQDNNHAFFIEGCVEYVTNMNDSNLFQHRLLIAKNYRDSLNYIDLITGSQDFYGQYSDANYSICGIFVMYIVDEFGVEAFKRYCLASDKKTATRSIFKKEMEAFTNGYKVWLDTQIIR